VLRQYADTRVHLGKPIKVGESEFTPYSRATILYLPGVSGGLVWSRPGGVFVKRSDGSETELPIRDETRIAQVTLLALGLLGGLAAWLFLRRGD
jgi:hypothetical protein